MLRKTGGSFAIRGCAAWAITCRSSWVVVFRRVRLVKQAFLSGSVASASVAGGALQPNFATVENDDEHHRPGGLVSNTRLQHALDHTGNQRTVYQVDRFAARGAPSAMVCPDFFTPRPNRSF